MVPSTSNNTEIITVSLPNSDQTDKLQRTIEMENMTEVESKKNLLSDDPGEWINDFTRDYVSIHGCNQNINLNFSNSKREYSDGKIRYLSKSLFQRKLLNGEMIPRP